MTDPLTTAKWQEAIMDIAIAMKKLDHLIQWKHFGETRVTVTRQDGQGAYIVTKIECKMSDGEWWPWERLHA